MDDEKKLNNDEEITENPVESSIEIEEEPQENQEEIVDVELSIDYEIEKVDELNEYESMVLASKVEVEIQKYEDILLKGEKEFLSYEELVELGYNDEEYKRLKKLDKALYKHVNNMNKAGESRGIFSYLPLWVAIVGAITFVFNVYPVNPLLFMHVVVNISEKYENLFSGGAWLAYLMYFIYVGVFYLPLLVGFIIYLIKGIKDKIARKRFYWFIGILLIDIGILIPGLLAFLKMMKGI